VPAGGIEGSPVCGPVVATGMCNGGGASGGRCVALGDDLWVALPSMESLGNEGKKFNLQIKKDHIQYHI
jgi:hypothetical protein